MKLNPRTLTLDAGALLAGGALVIGAWWVGGVVSERDHYRAEAAKPHQTATVTAPASSPTSRTASAPARPSTSPTAPELRQVVDRSPRQALSRPSGTSGGTAGAHPTASPSGPSPTPQPPARVACPVSARVLAITARVCTGG